MLELRDFFPVPSAVEMFMAPMFVVEPPRSTTPPPPPTGGPFPFYTRRVLLGGMISMNGGISA